jgi:hypothetical protein
MGKIPGYCDYQTAMKIAGAVFIGGVALWGATKIVKQAKKARAEIAAPASNPRRNGRGARVRGNPSAPGEMSTEPERKIARMTKGRLQEKQLANTVFRMENSCCVSSLRITASARSGPSARLTETRRSRPGRSSSSPGASASTSSSLTTPARRT